MFKNDMTYTVEYRYRSTISCDGIRITVENLRIFE